MFLEILKQVQDNTQSKRQAELVSASILYQIVGIDSEINPG